MPMESTKRDANMKAECDFDQAKRGAVIPQTGKTRIMLYVDDEILEAFRQRGDAAGTGYEAMMNEALRQYLSQAKPPLDEATLRRVLQEELRAASNIS